MKSICIATLPSLISGTTLARLLASTTSSGVHPMKAKTVKKLTDAQRHKRFVAMAREVEASESPRAFDRAFAKIVKKTAR
jgi:hypothetical protein